MSKHQRAKRQSDRQARRQPSQQTGNVGVTTQPPAQSTPTSLTQTAPSAPAATQLGWNEWRLWVLYGATGSLIFAITRAVSGAIYGFAMPGSDFARDFDLLATILLVVGILLALTGTLAAALAAWAVFKRYPQFRRMTWWGWLLTYLLAGVIVVVIWLPTQALISWIGNSASDNIGSRFGLTSSLFGLLGTPSTNTSASTQAILLALPIAALVGSMIGLALGMAQWVVLGRYVRDGKIWIAANVLAWLAAAVAMLATETLITGMNYLVVDAMETFIAGFMNTMITGWGFVALLRQAPMVARFRKSSSVRVQPGL